MKTKTHRSEPSSNWHPNELDDSGPVQGTYIPTPVGRYKSRRWPAKNSQRDVSTQNKKCVDGGSGDRRNHKQLTTK